MNSLLLSVALVFPMNAQEANQPRANDEKLPMQKLDGDWMVTYAEKDGKKLEGKAFTEVTIKGNVVTCRHDGKTHSWRLEFGPHNMVRCTEMIDGQATRTSADDKRNPNDKGYHNHYGVYIASPEYFCLAINRGMDRRNQNTSERSDGAERSAQTGGALRFGETGAHGAHFVVILHRVGTTPANSR